MEFEICSIEFVDFNTAVEVSVAGDFLYYEFRFSLNDVEQKDLITLLRTAVARRIRLGNQIGGLEGEKFTLPEISRFQKAYAEVQRINNNGG